MRPLIPEKYLTTHDYEDPAAGSAVEKYRFTMPNGAIPLDLAFCRWMACEYGVVFMPISFFYDPGSPNTDDSCVRMAICKVRKNIETTVERLRKVGNAK